MSAQTDQSKPPRLCVVLELNRQESFLSAFRGHTTTTVDFELLEQRRGEPYWQDRENLIDSCIDYACEAEWAHPTEKDQYGIAVYMKCMEIACYYISIPGDAIIQSRNFCKFHRPRVISI